MNSKDINRCFWVSSDELYIKYHDEEWGVKVDDDLKLFEFLLLESFQAGLSWITILKRRENFRQAFDQFDYKIISTYDSYKITELLNNKLIIRNRLKILAAINNAKLFQEIINEFGSFNLYLTQFTGSEIIYSMPKKDDSIVTKNDISDAISKDLKVRGFKFLGSTIIYSFLQATGFINDHSTECFLYHKHKLNNTNHN